MLNASALSIIVGVSGFVGFVALLAYLYLFFQYGQLERSVRETVEGEGLFNPDQIVRILEQFKDDNARLSALQTVAHVDTTKARALLRKVEANVDVAQLRKLSSSHYRTISGIAAVFFVVLAGLAFAYKTWGPESRPVSVTSIVAPVEGTEDRARLRAERGLRALHDTENDLPLSQLPNGVYGFTTPWSDPRNDMTLSQTPGGTVTLEVQKLNGGETHLVGFVDATGADQIASNASSAVIHVYTGPWEQASVLASVPVPRISSIRDRSFRDDYVLDIQLVPR